MITEPTIKKPKPSEITGPQTISFSWGDGVISRDYTKVGTYAQLRTVRKDPTVTLARGLLISCIQAGSWNIEADEDVSEDVTEFLKHILPLREDFLYNAVAYGRIDYGWCGFEKIFDVKDGRNIIKTLKPLLVDITNILVTKQGHFNGYRQTSVSSAVVDIFPEKCLHIAFEVEAGNFYGMPLLENIRQSFDDWNDCNAGAKRYDNKVAGSIWVVRYPPGTAQVNGETVDNGVIAGRILTRLESSGSVSIPTTAIDVVQELTNQGVKDVMGWHIELISDSGDKQAGFGTRLKYLDSQKVRGLLMPERAMLEGQFGTKAESTAHIDLMLNQLEGIDRTITRMVNQQLVNQLLQLNFGDELVDKVRLVSAPLVDEQIEFVREVYKDLSDPNIDVDALREKLDIPTSEGGSENMRKKNEFLKEEGKEGKEDGELVWKTEERVYKQKEKK